MTTHAPPSNARLRPAVDALTSAERENFEERAGILEYCCDVQKIEAEAQALRIVKER